MAATEAEPGPEGRRLRGPPAGGAAGAAAAARSRAAARSARRPEAG
jgi:hypothetical protein